MTDPAAQLFAPLAWFVLVRCAAGYIWPGSLRIPADDERCLKARADARRWCIVFAVLAIALIWYDGAFGASHAAGLRSSAVPPAPQDGNSSTTPLDVSPVRSK